ncbi:hypothetical protein CTAYLR_005072 [Chrysophaeum taylorii]|uniref:Uncharacterized protein n=1 Tax=Chrysophaeum taylorii TaxID=2483200 RepID=A0AAD7U9T9_9STRA|nr:hypothetical protein CTAYLR_005072 [Chrysophaeum taylorii]
MVQADGAGRSLPRKENDLFKSIVKFYETKQYKKGLKAADAVLRKFPNHGETLAMRGLVLNCLERKAEAYDHVKRGLKADMRSHVCWHVYGLLHRSDRRYTDAIKSYKQALRIDGENIQILRDLSLLQVQMRDRHGFLETRKELLRLKPNNKMHWIAYALANHLCDAKETAIQVIDAYSNSQEERSATYEDSELALYRNTILEEMGRYDEALAHLEATKPLIVDVRSWRERRAEMLLYTRRQRRRRSEEEDDDDESSTTSEEAARSAWIELLSSTEASGDNYFYHRGLQLAVLPEVSAARCREIMRTQRACELPTDAIELSFEQVERLDETYASLATRFPRGEAFLWIPLTYAPRGPAFERMLDSTIRRLTKRGAPALGSSLERLWEPKAGEVVSGRSRGREACELTLRLADAHVASLREKGRYGGDPNGGGTVLEPPTSLLWVSYLRAHCLEWLGDLEAALETIDECIRHTPSAVDLYEKRARLLKRSGDAAEAAEAMDSARTLDLADRYINNKATKYLLRAGRVADARRTAALFTRPEGGDSEMHLREMQATWYELEIGRALAARGDVGPALKKFVAVHKHFADFVDDQFDFHTYCVRKMTLRAYVSVLRFEDRIRGHAAFRRSALAAARVYLGLYDAKVSETRADAERVEPEAEITENDAAAAKARAKRNKQRQRKARAREARAAREGDNLDAPSADASKPKQQHQEDDDPEGLKLLAESRPPLVEASDLATQLAEFAPSRPETHALAFDVAERTGKILLAVRALSRLDQRCVAAKYDKLDGFYAPEAALVDRLSRFVVVFGRAALADGVVARVARTQIARLCGGGGDEEDLGKLVVAKIRAFAADSPVLPSRVAAATALARLEPAATDATAWVLDAALEEHPSRKPLGVKHFENALRALKLDIRADPETVDAFRATAARRFPRAPAFFLPDDDNNNNNKTPPH